MISRDVMADALIAYRKGFTADILVELLEGHDARIWTIPSRSKEAIIDASRQLNRSGVESIVHIRKAILKRHDKSIDVIVCTKLPGCQQQVIDLNSGHELHLPLLRDDRFDALNETFTHVARTKPT